MILSCNSCEKRFVIPDQAITAAGRTVQCGSCGNKWKQFPIVSKKNKITSDKDINTTKKTNEPRKPKAEEKRVRKTREINLYSPEYLARKHGIKLKDENINRNIIRKVTFGFYNSLIVLIVTIIALSKGLFFFQDYIVHKLPFTQFYLDYFFESIRNLFEIIRNLIFNY